MGIIISSKLTIVFVVYTCFNSRFTYTSIEESFFTILLWNFPPWESSMFSEMKTQSYFKNHNCTFQNCLLTSSESHFFDVRNYEVIVFHAISVNYCDKPEARSPTQLYVFFSDEPSAMYKVYDYYDEYFNLAWTYKLNSNATFKFIVVRNKHGKVIGPKRDMQWVSHYEMKRTSKHIIEKLQTKKTAAAWFVSHCTTWGNREAFVKKLSTELDAYGLKLDIFGCDYENLTCAKHSEECHALIESDYYFYLAFENSFCEDYITEKVLTATKHYAVPIVYSGADYNKFLPEGSYIDALALGPINLAKLMNKILRDKNMYYDYFRWHGYYSFHSPDESADTDEICAFCALLNNKTYNPNASKYVNLTEFWNSETNEEALDLIRPAYLSK